jgi:hypothetical protein
LPETFVFAGPDVRHGGAVLRRPQLLVARTALEQVTVGGFGEYFEPFTGELLGSDNQSWTAAVALDWLASGSQPEIGGAS